ncbi:MULTISPECIES: saccharopine dehydrogenase family protein [Streptomyces]|uniref:Saccharopine dehydrogenase NADP-binding domain-containing protein n=1 Tax=Streptomyces olivaceus TaxID=47716 RepID=A0ABS7W0C2_STROV|nr:MULTISPECIES: saccharopine dehydrogenase NADP-binding domain-containing protein [Streptomyces]MBZ6089016.1 saccharopine dehydrogenase NADP-binding domain-containing protein [Streptomyces olivaceus]MBZ6095610.1 saccharopine dehydrogenase NADP-binding domain-containing protein [Streptomyces olivaceus]MBZ6111766.1 saccharopine dehydrogenase NADP-binding domain-containing protein [Streptomyces olivaceus]MBZ6119879.1 saccharopine dehydrogenase NADP-binding domain-containing protein [Streptomyces 
MAATPRLLVYGATGYTGKLVARHAQQSGLDIVVAGRNRERITALGEELGLESRAFALDDPEIVRAALDGITVVLNVAGPFRHTARPLMDAGIAAGVHYLDTTAEYDIFAAARSRNVEAQAAGVMIMSGAGWDVVPSDSVAAHTAARVTDPVSLRLALKLLSATPEEAAGLNLFSRGSIVSATEGIGDLGVLVRTDGDIVTLKEPKVASFDFGDSGPEEAVSASMGDLVTSHFATGIPSIEVYVQAGQPLPIDLDLSALPDGPTAEEREVGRSKVVAEVTGRDGRVARSLIDTPTGYRFTQLSSVEIARRVLAGSFAPGFQSPSSAYGPEIALAIADTQIKDL